MVLIGLLIVAAACVILGVVLANVPLLIVSLVASLAAAGLLLRTYLKTREQAKPDRPVAHEPTHAAAPANEPVAVGVGRSAAATPYGIAAGQVEGRAPTASAAPSVPTRGARCGCARVGPHGHDLETGVGASG